MSTQDRRSGTERRSTNRFPVEVDVQWQGSGERMPGSVSDVSLDGCFVLSSGDVTDGETVKLFVPLADGMKVEFSGRVANHVMEIGFGLKFDQLSAAQRDVLGHLVRQANG
ncbi:MAG TPA: PilZ domain-containing protein [Pyrinomonadaceae bacterium]|nr:PilZ domain-containing protein [Acidobacteriota bacterium]HQZ97349.1 PilZ domain-containing protein [Pyrinomonadaceae bacterium]